MDQVKSVLFQSLQYEPWPSQTEFHGSTARFKFLGAGARYGKSKCAAYDVLPDIMKENTRGWIVGSTYLQPSKEFRYIYEALVVKLGFKPQKDINISFSTPGTQYLLFPWGAEVITKSEDNPESLLGEEIDWLILSEGSRLKEQTYDLYLRARLGTRMGRVIVPTTPHGYNWLYKRFYVPASDGNPDYWAKINIPVTENELFSREEFETARKELPEEFFREQYCGEFVSYSGLIFKRFNRGTHVMPPFVIPEHWVRYCAIDPHPQTAAGVLWAAFDEQGDAYVYDEMFVPGLTIPEIVEQIAVHETSFPNWPEDEKRKVRMEASRYLIDPNAKYIDKLRGQTSSVMMQFRKEGIPVIEAINKFESAFFKISEMLVPRPVYGQEGVKKPRLHVFNTCRHFIQEMETLTWEDEKKNHLNDCLRYIFNDNPSRTFSQEEVEEIKYEEESNLRERSIMTGY
jgi:hypothetical protein